MDALRRILVIAWTEARRSTGHVDRNTAFFLAGSIALSFALAPVVMDRGFDFQNGLYRADVEAGSPLGGVVDASPLFDRVPPGASSDVVIRGTHIEAPDTDKGRAALAALKGAARDYTFRVMAREPDASAAFPVRVIVEYVSVERAAGVPDLSGLAGETDATQEDPESGGGGGSGSGSGSGSAQGSGSTDGASSSNGELPPPPPPETSGGFDFLPDARVEGVPGSLSPPFPFRSLLLAYTFLIPMNFVVQVYAGSVMAERINRKGESLLASPSRPWEIIAGKALPYFAAMMGVGVLLALALGGGWLSMAGVLPLALAFLGLEFAAAMVARSFRELTFLTVFASVGLTIYAFLPAVFTTIHPISLVSPITLVVMDIKGLPVGLGGILYATLPLTLVSFALFLIGGALYREEDLFHQKRVPAKIVDALAAQVPRPRSAMRVQVLLLPFVFVAELLLVTFLHAWPLPVGLIGVLAAVAFVEEAFKAAPSAAGLARRRFKPTARAALAVGAFSGLGFFLAEKGFLLAGLMGLFEIPAGSAVFGLAGDLGTLPAWWPLLLVAPLLLHVVTASVSAWGARYGKRVFAAAFLTAVILHTLYNLTVVTLMGVRAA